MASAYHSWLAVQDVAGEDILAMLGLEETGEVADSPSAAAGPYFYVGTTDGWTVIFANAPGSDDPKIFKELSRRALVMGCEFQAQADEPSARLFAVRNGKMLWQVSASSDVLSVWDEPPPQLESIHRELKARIMEDRIVMDEVPFQLGKVICGFRHDEKQSFRGLRPLPASRWHEALSRAAEGRSGLFGLTIVQQLFLRLFGYIVLACVIATLIRKCQGSLTDGI